MIISDLDTIRDQVHTISWYYHWSKDAILSLSALDRSEYVSRIRKQIERENKASGADS